MSSLDDGRAGTEPWSVVFKTTKRHCAFARLCGSVRGSDQPPVQLAWSLKAVFGIIGAQQESQLCTHTSLPEFMDWEDHLWQIPVW